MKNVQSFKCKKESPEHHENATKNESLKIHLNPLTSTLFKSKKKKGFLKELHWSRTKVKLDY